MPEQPEKTTKTTDSIDALLNQVAQGAEFHFQSGLCGDWALPMNKPSLAGLHLVTQGHCWFGLLGNSLHTQQLHAGDVIFVNQGVSHFLSHSPIPNNVTESEIPSFCIPEHKDNGIVCYDIESPSTTTDIVFSLLPPWLIISTIEQATTLQNIINMIRDEAKSPTPGHQAIVQRLSEVLAIQFLRAVVEQGAELRGPLAALHDRQLRPLVLALVQQPGADWTVETMSQQVFLSTSAFAERCLKHTGLSPKKLLDQIRLQRAQSLLMQSTLSIETISLQLGYQSTTAFSRFFKKYTGVSASSYRHPE